MFKRGFIWRGRCKEMCKVGVYLLVSRYKNDVSGSLATHGRVIFLPISMKPELLTTGMKMNRIDFCSNKSRFTQGRI